MHATNTVSLKHRKYKEQVFSALRGIASRAGVPRAPSVFRHSGLRPLAAERLTEVRVRATDRARVRVRAGAGVRVWVSLMSCVTHPEVGRRRHGEGHRHRARGGAVRADCNGEVLCASLASYEGILGLIHI